MKIVIRPNAAEVYRLRVVRYGINWKWYATLWIIQGLTLDVETKYLFIDQFNTAPLDVNDYAQAVLNMNDFTSRFPHYKEQANQAMLSITGTGLRVRDESVAQVIDDERIGKASCRWCGHHISAPPVHEWMTTPCPNCGKTGYLSNLAKFVWKT